MLTINKQTERQQQPLYGRLPMKDSYTLNTLVNHHIKQCDVLKRFRVTGHINTADKTKLFLLLNHIRKKQTFLTQSLGDN